MWVSTDGRTVLPDSLLSPMARHIHGPTHIGRDAMVRTFRNYWFNSKFRVAAEELCHRCVTCQQNNVGKRTPVVMSYIGRSGGIFNRMKWGFVEMPRHQGLRYILMVVCIFSSWVEAYPTKRNDKSYSCQSVVEGVHSKIWNASVSGIR